MKRKTHKHSNGPVQDVWRKLKKDKWAMASMFVVILLFLIALFAPLLMPYDYAVQDPAHVLEFPSLAHPFGTDNFGRDIFSRVIYGSRYTIFVSFGCITLSAAAGVVIGLIAAYFSKLDNIIMRAIDVIIGLPSMTLLMCLISVMGISLTNMILALCVTSIPSFARVVRAQAMTLKEQEFVEAARAIGASDWRILIHHILPNALAPVIVQYSLGAGNVVLMSASLSFIGMGVQAPNPEWGLMISAGRDFFRTNWYMSIIPGLAIVMLTYALNYMGDGLRDALDPRLNK